ncbi:hypothetical protein LSH36_447g02035 [Paralvinella palmiformis]|uniref:ADP-ribosylhydrolase ARH3 n=1 Tax=Paralvinella palmiformis TaxID=53620 RepID=A0AAD9MXK5_9ANNE|nr:hypothetical protein LSH36_447g02035 [Paralvinella palmiformis]
MAARELIRNVSLLSKFKGAMVGAVIGDCIGAGFEGELYVELQDVLSLVEKIEKKEVKQLGYTDDTAMARSVAYSLIEKKHLDSVDMAKRFSEEYNKDPCRHYGASVGNVFNALIKERYSEPHGPASRQFDGQGSYGNGSSMRIAPAALFGYNMADELVNKIVEDISRITHSHRDAINGAILQCSAVLRALKDTTRDLNTTTFLDKLSRKMYLIESNPGRARESKPYRDKMNQIANLIASCDDPSTIEFNKTIGSSITGLDFDEDNIKDAIAELSSTSAAGPDKTREVSPMIQLLSPSEKGDIQTLEAIQAAFTRKMAGIGHLDYWEQLKKAETLFLTQETGKIYDYLYLAYSGGFPTLERTA